MRRDFITFVQMYCAMSFLKILLNICFVITEQGNKVQYPCAFGVACAAIIICKSLFYIQNYSEMPVVLNLLPWVLQGYMSCFCSAFIGDGGFSPKL